MRFRLTDDQRALREGLREALARRFDGEALRAAVEGAAGRIAFDASHDVVSKEVIVATVGAR